jgi:hypothetical protein
MAQVAAFAGITDQRNSTQQPRAIHEFSQGCRTKWTPSEDRSLTEAIATLGTSSWNLVSKFVAGRTGKQCRERWVSHLAPSATRVDPWTPHEDATLIRLQKEYGNAWTKMAASLPGRSGNNIKNRWNLLCHGMIPMEPKILAIPQGHGPLRRMQARSTQAAACWPYTNPDRSQDIMSGCVWEGVRSVRELRG